MGPTTKIHRHLVRVLLVLSVIAMSLTATSGISGANELPFTSLEQALNELEAARVDHAAIEHTLVLAQQELAASSSTLSFVESSDLDRVQALESWRVRSRQLAVESYINGGSATATSHLLDSSSTSMLTYRAGLIEAQALASIEASRTYAELLGGADDDVIVLIEDIDGLHRRAEGLKIDIVRAQMRVVEAEWVVDIAKVHAAADLEFERTGRRQPTQADWADLRMCESTNTYDINSGNGFYGAYQFDFGTWFTVGGAAGTRADMAPPEEQDARARLLYAGRGSQPWPECGWRLDS